MSETPLHVSLATRGWTAAFAVHKLRARRTLPGAFSYDEVARGFAAARDAGAEPRHLLPAALSASLLLNSGAGAREFAAWLGPDHRATWDELVLRLDVAPAEWLARSAQDRAAVGALASALAPTGDELAMLTKVLALLCPRLVPAMQDGVVAFFTGAPLPIADADAQTRGVGDLVGVLDAFASELASAAPDLDACARAHEPRLTPAQLLDRVLWFETCGYQGFHDGQGVGWWWVADAGREAIVPVGKRCSDALVPGARVELAQVRDAVWRDAARDAMSYLPT